jgi:hypothetical protein
MAITLEQARAAKESAKTLLASLPGVVGVGITKIGDDYALKVNLGEPLPAGLSAPERIEDVPVRVEVVGTIRKRGPR